jgi:hypothetical protein
MAKFLPGNPGGPGRPRGVKNKLVSEFINALVEDFQQHGRDAIRIARIEDPVRYVAILAGLMPKNLEIEHTRLGELSDEELDALLEYARERRAKLIEQSPERITNANGRHEPATVRRP